MKPYTVYFLCDEMGNPFYVGCTNQYTVRLRWHIKSGQLSQSNNWSDAQYLKIQKMREILLRGGSIVGQVIFTTDDQEKAERLEREIIEYHTAPLTNWMYRPKHLRLPRPRLHGARQERDVYIRG